MIIPITFHHTTCQIFMSFSTRAKPTWSPVPRVTQTKKVSYRGMNPYAQSNRKRCADQQRLACLARISPYIDRSDARRRSDVLPLATVGSGSRHAPPMQQQLEPRYAYNMHPSTGLMMDWKAGGEATNRVAAAVTMCTCIR